MVGGGKPPEVGVCVLTLNSETTVGHVLKLLLAQDYPKDRIHYLVVDGGSSDGTLEVVRGVFGEVPGLRYAISVLTGSNIPQARNECLRRLTREGVDYVLFVDSDVLVAATNAIRKLVELVELTGGGPYCTPQPRLSTSGAPGSSAGLSRGLGPPRWSSH